MKQEISFKVPATEIENRIESIQKHLQDYEIQGLFIVQRVDLYYFSGTAQNGFLYIPDSGEPVLFVKKYLPRAKKESSIKNILGISSIKEVPGLIQEYCNNIPKTLGFEFDVMPVREFNFYSALFPETNCVDCSELILKTRMLKSEWEIVQLEKSAHLSSITFEYMKESIRPGLTEIEFAGMFETFSRRNGHGAQLRVRDYLTEGYTWHILSGKSGGTLGLLDSPASGEGTSPAFPCGAGNKKIEKNEPIMIDFGSVLNGYHIDETRMFVIGDMPEKAMKASASSIEIHDSVIEKAKPGVTLGELFEHSVSMADSLGYSRQYLGTPDYKVTFVGHGVGLELVETPIISKGRNDVLQPGMTFALEPKMVFENEFSAGIESVFTITERGSRLISTTPVEIFLCD